MYARHVSLAKVHLLLSDIAAAVAAMASATLLRHGTGFFGPAGAVDWQLYLPLGVGTGLLFAFFLRRNRLYAIRPPPLEQLQRIARATAIATMAVLTVGFFARVPDHSRLTIALFFPLCTAYVFAARQLTWTYQRLAFTDRRARRRVVIVGDGEIAERLGQALQQRPFYYDLIGIVSSGLPSTTAGRTLGNGKDLAAIVRAHRIDEVLIATGDGPGETMALIGCCMSIPVRWKAVPYFYDLMFDRMSIDDMDGVPLVGVRGSSAVGFDWVLKRCFDVAFSAAALVLLSPLLLGVTLLVKLTSRGPVLYRQNRIGLNGQSFEFLKFRTMRVESNPTLHEEYTRDWIYGRTGQNGSPTPSNGVRQIHKIAADPRITPIGSILRRISLDELPQFWNVLRGEMSVVGPRPAIPYEVARYSEWHKARLSVLPGITGLWQVSGRNELSFEEMVRLDIEYINGWSLERDVEIVLRTLPAMFLSKAS